jgi:hypothetical protein
VLVTGEGGGPLSGAQVSLAGLQRREASDAQGQVTWTNIPQTDVTIAASAQGYEPAEISTSLVPGVSEVRIAMKRAPFGLLPEAACAAGEELLYAEDFQDGEVTNWGSYPPGTPFAIQADPSEAKNAVLALNFGAQDGEFQVRTIPSQDSIVRRFKYKPGNHSRFNAGWGTGQDGYFVVLSADEFALHGITDGAVVRDLARAKPVMQQGVWHLLEIATVAGRIEVRADGAESFTYEGPPQEAGDLLGIGSAFLPADSVVLVDDLSVCRTSGSFTSISPAP